jgi:hypothetical protein
MIVGVEALVSGGFSCFACGIGELLSAGRKRREPQDKRREPQDSGGFTCFACGIGELLSARRKRREPQPDSIQDSIQVGGFTCFACGTSDGGCQQLGVWEACCRACHDRDRRTHGLR